MDKESDDVRMGAEKIRRTIRITTVKMHILPKELLYISKF